MAASFAQVLPYVGRHYANRFDRLLELLPIDAELLRPVANFMVLMDVNPRAVCGTPVLQVV
jgi:hypothetical protein